LGESIIAGEEEAVNAIARGHQVRHRSGKQYDFYSFATKYCHFHHKAAYPIFDRNVRLALSEYLKQEPPKERQKSKIDWRDYPTFVSTLESFRSTFKLETVPLDVWINFYGKSADRYTTKRRDRILKGSFKESPKILWIPNSSKQSKAVCSCLLLFVYCW